MACLSDRMEVKALTPSGSVEAFAWDVVLRIRYLLYGKRSMLKTIDGYRFHSRADVIEVVNALLDGKLTERSLLRIRKVNVSGLLHGGL